ncbi:chemotaxis protein CheX [Desulfobacterales bacterium HSG2]|nr:chemotaxis protein CheX [Desulfobacterales bacterium HSG2]
MNEEVKETLYNVAEDVLEKLAFIFSFPEDERENMDYSGAMGSRVSFAGPFTGALVMAVSVEALPELAGNMLGLEDEEETTLEQQQDALKELINVVCGNLLPAISGKKSVFNVNPPEIIPNDDPVITTDGPQPIAIAKMDIDDGQCDLLLFVDGELPAQTD